jgi:hypothetical protein
MRLATLLSALAVAAASLNVTLTNNLVGVTTVRVNGAGLRVEATLGADSSLFHAGAVARHVRPVDVAVGAPPAPLLRRRAAAAAAAAAAEPVPGDAIIITRGVVVCPAGAVVPADGLVGSDHSSFLPHVLILTTISRAPPTPPSQQDRRQSRPRRPGERRRAAREPSH